MSENTPQPPTPETPPVDWAAISRHLDVVFTKDCDVWSAACSLLFGNSDTFEQRQQRRQLFKLVFHRIFQLRAPLLIASTFNYTDHLLDELKKRGVFDDVDDAVSATMEAESSEREKRLRLEGLLP